MKKTILLLVSVCLALFANAQVTKTINVPTAGTLYKYLSSTERTTVTDLTITGTIDARDFKTMRDSMLVLSVLDIKDVVIAPYTGKINEVYSTQTFDANTLPNSAFFQADLLTDNTTLTSISLPTTTVAIGTFAFFNCKALKTIFISKLITSIAPEVFWACSAVITVDPQNPNYSSQDGVLFNKDKTTLIQCPSSKSGAYIIPSTVNVIGYGAFSGCKLLTSLTIPASVNSIEENAFYNCTSLIAMYLKNTNPTFLVYNFYSIENSKSILYVPLGTKTIYQTQSYGKYFYAIEETDFVGFEELENEKIIVSPNPAKESISVYSEGKSDVLIYSLSGGLMLHTTVSHQESVSLSSLPASVYVVKVITEKATTMVQQFIKL